MPRICWFQRLNCEDLLIFSALYFYFILFFNWIILGFWMRTVSNLKMSPWIFFTLTKKKIWLQQLVAAPLVAVRECEWMSIYVRWVWWERVCPDGCLKYILGTSHVLPFSRPYRFEARQQTSAVTLKRMEVSLKPKSQCGSVVYLVSCCNLSYYCSEGSTFGGGKCSESHKRNVNFEKPPYFSSSSSQYFDCWN